MEYERLLSRYDYAELRLERCTESYIQVKDDEVKHSSGTSHGMSVRVMEDGSWGFASGTEDIEALLERARRLAGLAKGRIRLRLPRPEKKEIRERTDIVEADLQVKELLEGSKAMKEKGITSRILSCSDMCTVTEFYNSEGAGIIQEAGHTYLSCSSIARSDGIIQRGSERAWSKSGFGKMDVIGTAVKSKDKAIRLVHAAPPHKGRFTVVFDPEMTGVFSHEAVGHACEGDTVVDRESLLAGRIGERIGSELVTIIDDPGARDFGYYCYDDEGVKAEPVSLVEGGALSGFLNSMETAQELQERPNGHARAGDYSQVPVVRMSNTYFQRGESAVDDVFDIKSGVYLKGMKGGSVDTFSGGFMFKAEEAYEIKDGEKGNIMRDVTITGNILQTLLDVECVGKDFGSSPGICGKFGQEVPVSDGGPHIRVSNVTIG